jgi:hypothetical protein
MPKRERSSKDLARSAEAAAVEVLAETISENDLASPRYQAGLCDDIKKDGWSIAVIRNSGLAFLHGRTYQR